MKMISATDYVFYLEELRPDRSDGKSEVHFRWNEDTKKWLVTWKGLLVLDSEAAQLIKAAVAMGMPPAPPPLPSPPPKRKPKSP